MTASTASAKHTVVVSMVITAGVVWIGHGANVHPGPEGLLAATVVAFLLAELAEVAPSLASAFAVVILVSAFLDNGAGFTKALNNLTKKAGP